MTADSWTYDAIRSFVLLVIFFEGFLSFAGKIFGFEPVLALPRHLGAPAWWIVSGLVVISGGVVLETIDRAKKHAQASV